MAIYLEIKSVHAREILDSRGNPTVEAQVTKPGERKALCRDGSSTFRRQHGKI